MVNYYFTIQVMLPHPDMRHRLTPWGCWRPPKARGNNRLQLHKASNGSTVPWTLAFRHDGQLPMNQTRAGVQLPSTAKLFKTMSVYHAWGILWAVPYDATRHKVGDGYEVPGVAECDSDDRSDGEEDNADWAELSFAAARSQNPLLSYAGLRKRSTRLLTHRPNQLWHTHFLPDRYQSHTPTDNPQAGGLVGELPLLIALAALSQAQGHWPGLLPQTIRNFGQGTPGWQVPAFQLQHVPRGSQWLDRRGLVVSVFYDPGETTAEDLQQYEGGGFGPILV